MNLNGSGDLITERMGESETTSTSQYTVFIHSLSIFLYVEEALFIFDSILLEEVKIHEFKWGGGLITEEGGSLATATSPPHSTLFALISIFCMLFT